MQNPLHGSIYSNCSQNRVCCIGTQFGIHSKLTFSTFMTDDDLLLLLFAGERISAIILNTSVYMSAMYNYVCDLNSEFQTVVLES